MRTIENIKKPEGNENILENWDEEEFFWALDGLFVKACPYILIFTVLYLLAHVIYRALTAGGVM